MIGVVTLCIADDGIGFELPGDQDRFGLVGMKERAELVGATLEVSRRPDTVDRVFAIAARAKRRAEADDIAGVHVTPIRVLIADDHEIVRHGLRLLVDAQEDMEVVAEASDGDVALDHARALQPASSSSICPCPA